MMEKKFELSKFDSIEAVTNQALDSLNRMRLTDAEGLYLKLINHIKETGGNKRSLIKCYEGLAEVYLKHSSRLHVINKLEWQWMNIQAIILLQQAVTECSKESRSLGTGEDYTWFCDKRTSVLMKLHYHQERLMISLQENMVFESQPDIYVTLHRIFDRDQRSSVEVGGWLDKLQTYCKNRLAYGATSTGTSFEIPEPKVEVVEKKSRKTAEYFREKYNKIHQKFLFHSPSAIKYGLSDLDKARSRSMSMTCLDQFQISTTFADIQNQNCVTASKRPQSLNIKPICRPSPEQRFKKAFNYLKKKAETLKKRLVHTPTTSWRGIIDQHKNILNETLDDFNVDYEFLNNSQVDESDYDSSDNGLPAGGAEMDQSQTKTCENGNIVNQAYFCRTKGDNVIEYDEGSILEDQAKEEDTGFCRDRVVDPLNFSSDYENCVESRGEKRKHGDFGMCNDNMVVNSSQQLSKNYSYQRTVNTQGKTYTESMRASLEEYGYDGLPLNSTMNLNGNSEISLLEDMTTKYVVPSGDHLSFDIVELEAVDSEEVQLMEGEQTETLSPLSAIRKRARYVGGQTLPIEDLSPHELRTYRLHTFEACSPVTETSSLHFDLKRDLVAGYQNVKSEKMAAKSMVLPINDQNIQITLGHSILLMADNFFNQGQLKKASSVYEKALGLFHSAYKESGVLDENMAYILLRLGILRTRSGDIIGGIGLMEQTMRMLNIVHKTDVHIRLAEVWYEMGNAYVMEHQHGETLRDHVILTIRDELHAEILDYAESDDDDYDDECEVYMDRNIKQSYSVSTYEALTCYQHALAILKELEGQDKVYTDLMAKVLTKLGDCSVIINNFDGAVQYYERALGWFPNARERSSLPSNAHVMCMLGVVRFLVRRYTKASAMFQCARLMYQHIRIEDSDLHRFEFAYVLSLLSFSHYATKQYYKATASALKAIEIYTDMYQDRIQELEEESFWLINQTIYTLGYAYLSVDSYQKALEFLQRAKEYSRNSPFEDRVQIVLILKAIGDCFEGLERHETALKYYCDALADNNKNEGVGLKSSSLQNQLLSKTAGMHVSMQQYTEAAERLEQAHDAQIDMEDDIRGDLVSLLHRLGQTHTLACDIDKAMECYLECIEAYGEDHESLGPEMSATYGNLATLCHVKACMTEYGDVMDEMLSKAEDYYQIAIDLEFTAVLALKYANFLFHQGSYIETVLIVQQLLDTDGATGDVIFSGIEQVIAPELIQLEIEEEEIVITSSVFSKYLLVVCYCHMGELDNAEYYIIDLMDAVYCSEKPLMASILGYCMLELGIFDEARIYFERAVRLSKEDSSIALRMYCYCMCLELFQVLERAQLYVYEHYIGPLPCFPSFGYRKRSFSVCSGGLY